MFVSDDYYCCLEDTCFTWLNADVIITRSKLENEFAADNFMNDLNSTIQSTPKKIPLYWAVPAGRSGPCDAWCNTLLYGAGLVPTRRWRRKGESTIALFIITIPDQIGPRNPIGSWKIVASTSVVVQFFISARQQMAVMYLLYEVHEDSALDISLQIPNVLELILSCASICLS